MTAFKIQRVNINKSVTNQDHPPARKTQTTKYQNIKQNQQQKYHFD